MNLMMIGIVVAVAGAGVELLANESDKMSPHSQMLWALIAGSFGLVANVANFRRDEEICPRKIARQTLAALPLSAMFGPLTARTISSYLKMELDLSLLVCVSGLIGLGGPYLMTKYGQQIADWAASYGIGVIKKKFGDDLKG